jgi:hypothetical protein
MTTQPQTLGDFVEVLHREYVCERCQKYVGSVSRERYLPAPYPVAVGALQDDEVAALVGFEWYMLGLMRDGKFVLRHPERHGACISFREWISADEADDQDADVDAGE